jgi:hypothetical protein
MPLTREQGDAIADAQSQLIAAYDDTLRAITAMNIALAPVLYPTPAAPADADAAGAPPPSNPAP